MKNPNDIVDMLNELKRNIDFIIYMYEQIVMQYEDEICDAHKDKIIDFMEKRKNVLATNKV